MRPSLLTTCLLVSSLQTISWASALISIYNVAPVVAQDSLYAAHVFFMILACVGVVIALYAFAYPDMFTNNYWMTTLALVWTVVTVITSIIAYNFLNKTIPAAGNMPAQLPAASMKYGYALSLIVSVVVLAVSLVGTFS